MDPAYVEKLHVLLSQTVAPDTNVIKQATAALNKEYYKSPICIPALFQIISQSPDQSVRQLAAVELRKRISQTDGKLWKELPQDARIAIQSQIMPVIIAEPASIVRHSAARVIAAIANLELPHKTWPTLTTLIEQACTSATPIHREVGIYVLYSILESILEILKEPPGKLFPLFERLIKDQGSMEVRVTTVRALGTLAQYIELEDKQDIHKFQTLLPDIIGVIKETIDDGNEDGARSGFDVLETLLIIETPLLSKNIPDLVKFCLTVGGDIKVDDEIRQMALNALNWTIKYKKSKIQALNLATDILQRLLPIGAEADPEDNDEDSPSRLAFRAVDALATVLPPQQVFIPLHQLITGYMADLSTERAGLRKASMMAFGVTVEGCSEFIRPHMKDLWPLLDQGFEDPDAIVRKAACIAFACICEWLEDECVERHDILLPKILKLVNDPVSQGPACTALDAYLEIMGPKIEQYLHVIMEQLVHLLDNAPIPVKSIITGAIGSAAHASKQKFNDYFDVTISRLQPFLLLTNEGEELDLRGIATDAIGTIAEAVGRERFRPFFPDMMINAFQAVDLGSARLKECSFLFFGVMAKVFEDEFAPYLDRVVPALIESLKQLESMDDIDKLANGAAGFETGDDTASLLRAAGGDVDGDAGASLSVNSAIAIEKEIAADTMGTVFSCSKAYFFPYIQECTIQLKEMLEHYYEGIRKSAISSLFEFIKALCEVYPTATWEPGVPLKVALHSEVNALIKDVMPTILIMWQAEDDKSVVSQLCAGLAEAIASVGPGLVVEYIRPICKELTNILDGKSLCQQDPDADEEDEVLEGSAEFDVVLISAACDVVSSLSSAFGAEFVQAFATFLPLIRKYTAENRSNTERASAMGTIGEIVTGIKEGITDLTVETLTITFTGLSDPDAEVRSNAAFATGVLVENTNADLTAHYERLLGALQHLFNVTPSSSSFELHAKDNAAGCVSRMIVKNADAMPLDRVLPILLNALPLENDTVENKSLYTAIFHLFDKKPDAILPFIDQLLPAFVFVLRSENSDHLDPDTRENLIKLIHILNNRFPEKIAANGLNALL